MKNRAIVPAFVAVSLMYAVCVSNVPAVELLSRMTSKLGKAEAKCGAAVQKSAKQKSAKQKGKSAHSNILSGLVSHIQKSVAPKSGGKAKSSPKQKSAAQKSAKQKSAKQKSKHAPLKDLLSHITGAVQPKQKSAKQKSAKSGGHVRNLLDRVVRRAEPKCGAEVQGKKASAAKHHDDATPPPAPEVSNEA